MVKIYTNEEYAKSYTELIEILKYFSKSDLLKIPKNNLLRYIRDKDNNYSFSYNPDLDINEQNISKLTQILFANLYIDYFADDSERQSIKNKDQEELQKLEKQKQEKYNIETIFNKRKTESINNNLSETTSLTIIPVKENIFKRFLYKIRCILKLK